MRAYACILLGCLAATNIMAVPARREWQTKKLSDGSEVRVCLVGDEYYHFWQTEDDKIALPQEDGTFVLSDETAPTSKEIRARKKASPMFVEQPHKIGTPNLAPRGLVILAAYEDVDFQAENTQTAMSDMMNKEGYDYNGATGSAADYFKAQSNGQYAPIFDVVGPVVLPNNRAYYGANTSKPGTDIRPDEMIYDACAAVDKLVDFSQYDSNNDGKIDLVYVIYAGKGEADGGPAESIWPHRWTSYGTFDGKSLYDYACSGELEGFNDDNKRNGIGTICHEFGHVIGLPDYYDTNYKTNYDAGLTPNDWNIMDQGCYNNDGKTPPNYSIFDKYFIGWATPKFLAKDDQKFIQMTTDYNDAYQITGSSALVPYYSTDTVLYIENRQPDGWDTYLPGHGMIVWQVVYDQDAWDNNAPNNTANKPRLTLLAADGNLMIGNIVEQGVTLHEGKSDPFPGTANIEAFYAFTGCELTDIQETDGVIKFSFNGAEDPATNIENPMSKGDSRKMLHNGQLFIIHGNKTYTIYGQNITTFNN